MFPHRFFEGGALPSAYADQDYASPLRTDFRVWLKYEYLQGCSDLSLEEKAAACSRLCMPGHPPNAPLSFLVDAMIWFHSCADSERMIKIKTPKRAAELLGERGKTFCLFWDFWEVWASFKQQYDMDLYMVDDLHWWEFKRLLRGLGEDTPAGELRRLRGMTKDQYLRREAGIKKEHERAWGWIELDQRLAMLPE